jgi:hypothetical protein
MAMGDWNNTSASPWLMARARLEVVAAVASSGQAAIKRLLIDGVPVYDEPPF